jgi:hypothetical protein
LLSSFILPYIALALIVMPFPSTFTISSLKMPHPVSSKKRPPVIPIGNPGGAQMLVRLRKVKGKRQNNI